VGSNYCSLSEISIVVDDVHDGGADDDDDDVYFT